MKEKFLVILGAFVFCTIAAVVIIGIMGLVGMLTGNLSGGGGSSGNQVDCSGVAELTPEQAGWVKEAASIHLSGDEAALIALIQIESSWKVDAQAPGSSAAGLGQFITSTAQGFKEFVGGDDKHGNTWPAGTVSDARAADDARFDAKRSIFATGHYLSGQIERWGSLGDAYEFGYHGGTTDAQKAEAKKGRERLEKVYNDLKNGGGCTSGSGSASGEGCGGVPQFKQCDSQWGSKPYGRCGTICSSGCGVTSAAMVLKFYGQNVDPAMMAKESADNGYRACGAGTSYGFFPYIAKKYGLKNENNLSWNKALDYLKQGKPVIASGDGPPPFTNGGHFIVLTCLNDDGTISVNDSDHKDIGPTNYPLDLIKQHQHFLTVIY